MFLATSCYEREVNKLVEDRVFYRCIDGQKYLILKGMEQVAITNVLDDQGKPTKCERRGKSYE